MLSNSKTKKNSSQKKIRNVTTNVTRKKNIFERLQKSLQSRISDMESYKISCGKNLLIGYDTIKSSEETSIHKDDFVHVILSKLKNYNKPVVVKVYDEDNFHLQIELNILRKVNNFRNTAQLICDFSCNDDKNKYITKIKKQLRFCSDGLNKLHFFVYEYIIYGDVSDFLLKNKEITLVKSVILQITCVIIQLAVIYKIYHGDINTGNILIDKTNEKIIKYEIEDTTFMIESYGIIPKIIDYGRSNFYKGDIPIYEVWFDIILILGVIYPYIQNMELKKKVLEISKIVDLDLPSLTDYYMYIVENI
jgi:serine/threonine protein kinase